MVVGLHVLADCYGKEVQGHLPFQCVRSDKSWRQRLPCLDLDQRFDQRLE